MICAMQLTNSPDSYLSILKTSASKDSFVSIVQSVARHQHAPNKNSSFFYSEIDDYYMHPASSLRGVRAIVTIREAGMRWPYRVAARSRVPTNNIDADGEIVWS
jgi:hypothetical protein